MKNLFTRCFLILLVASTITNSVLGKGTSTSLAGSWLHLYDDCYVLQNRVSLSKLFPAASVQMMMPCPMSVEIDLGPGECGREVVFGFSFPDISVSTLQFNQNSSQVVVDGTIYCPVGQTKYQRTFAHNGPTDLTITSVSLGVYQSSNSPTVRINFYDATTNELYGSHLAVIPNLSAAVHTINIPAGIKIPRLSSYITEIVANAPVLSVFKIGRNNAGNIGNDAVVIADNCTPASLTVEGTIGTPATNSIVFYVTGTPDDYYYDNLNNNFESGDVFPIGSHVMSYLVTDANGASTACAFNVDINEFDNATGAIACNDLVHVSLGEDCEAIVTPQMVLQGNEYGCYDNYTVKITSLTGINLGNRVSRVNIGQKLKVQITGPNGNSCWGEVLVEDKFGPDFICEDIYATCSTDLSPGSPLSTRVPVSALIQDKNIPENENPYEGKVINIPVSNLEGLTITDVNVYLDITHPRVSDLRANITSPDGTTVPLFLNSSCNGANFMATFDDEAINSYAVYQNTCEAVDIAVAGTFQPYNPLSVFDGGPLVGNWVIRIFDNVSGQTGTVNNVEIIFSQSGGFIPFPTDEDVDWVEIDDNTYRVVGIDDCSPSIISYTDEVIEESCLSIYAKVIRRCWQGSDALGNPANSCCQTIYVYRNGLATLTFPPNYDGTPGNLPPLSCLDYGDVIPSDSITGRPTGDLCYNVEIVDPVDVIIPLCGKTYKIIRTHKVVEWCNGQVIMHNQIIKVADTQGPLLECPNDTIISTDDYTCSATYTIPRPKILEECSDTLVYQLSYQPVGVNEGVPYIIAGINQVNGTITGLPMGQNYVRWIVTDECGNSSSCEYIVEVRDLVRPVPVCDIFTVVSITGNGKAIVDAFTFDDGSHDNCGILKYEARKMTDKCNFGTTFFTPTVEFCCEEVNTSVMVELRVTDLSGNSNTCMVEVKVNDKLPPYITKCPADITLDCQADYTDLSVTKEPLYVDNCSVDSVSYKDQVNLNQCGVGTVTRTWTVKDKQGLKHSCVQVITLFNFDPFYYNIYDPFDPENDITWPENYETKKCHSLLTPDDLPAPYDRPTFNDDNCSLVATTYKDQIFKFVDGACEKILRTWTVIDWCTFNENNPQSGVGIYEHVQIIKLLNDIPPIFEFACVDRTFASYGNCAENIDFTMTAIDDCPEDNTNLNWKYEFDLFDDGTIDFVVASNRFNRLVPDGRHRIRWTVEDKCGNRAFCNQIINVIDSKKPTPYCISSLTTAVMNSNGTISIWAKDYDKGSYDNCTTHEDLVFTFFGATPVDSLIKVQHYFKGEGEIATEAEYLAGLAQIWIPSTNSSGMVFDCADIPDGMAQDVEVEMWVTDLAGNQDYCTLTLVLQDNADVCPNSDGTSFVISGRTSGGNGTGMFGCEVRMESNFPEANKVIQTDVTGSYSFANLPRNWNYTVSMRDDRNFLNGVSTLDIVLIQRHILDIERLTDPLKIIAADVDNNAKVSSSDLVALRKAILGIDSRFPNSQTSWRFITSNHTFIDPAHPFPFTEKYVFTALSGNKVNQNFAGIKIGDINRSATINAQDPSIESRSISTLTYEWGMPETSESGEQLIPIYADGFGDILGSQFTLRFDASVMDIKAIVPGQIAIQSNEYSLHAKDKGLLTFAWSRVEAANSNNQEPLFYLRTTGNAEKGMVNATLTADITPSVAYDKYHNALDQTLKRRSDDTPKLEYALYQNQPNPFVDRTIIPFSIPKADLVMIKFYDLDGKVLLVKKGQYEAGEHTMSVSKEELGVTGMLLVKMESGAFTDTKKMIVIE